MSTIGDAKGGILTKGISCDTACVHLIEGWFNLHCHFVAVAQHPGGSGGAVPLEPGTSLAVFMPAMMQRMSVVIEVIFNNEKCRERYLVRKKMYSIVAELMAWPRRIITRATAIVEYIIKIVPKILVENLTRRNK